MIVSLTRGDLRDESGMADEAFALSPISARATQPREEDYHAISEAFMETSRGRWFLGEYAKRNRNADTRMVLDAVARIEQSLAAQRQPDSEKTLSEVLAAIAGVLEEARSNASTALGVSTLEENLAPVRKGARIIREISWRWREIGGDSRICDLLDSQVSAIEGACGQIAEIDPMSELNAAFDLIGERIATFGDPEPVPAAATVASSPDPEEMAAEDMAAEDIAAPETATAQVVPTTETGVACAESTDADMANDDALLDMIAFEMAAPDPSDAEDPFDTDAEDVRSGPSTGDSVVPAHPREAAQPAPPELKSQPLPQPSATEPAAVQPFFAGPPPVETVPAQHSPVQSPIVQSTLGESLLANGIVRKPNGWETDALAPIRRMSQAERIAFFS